ncbi:1,4-Dihydroxy-2-naphthoyl-CoA synthase [Gossypium arboreum]|uniref:1,4-Dihydroxy-2-naphthoyl-CoA synthase n=1 Tax=Gossypium arboreum TaxID=29729 RepID=A0A0B0NIH3_GOSAR|nr:1,4-Dihydroxy-2-naphthoyl-CoA synthase [Gossypium arboreum]
MQCSKEAVVRLFYNISSSSLLLLLFLYCSSILLSKFFYFIGSYPLIQRDHDGYEFSEEEEEEEEEYGGDRYNYRMNCMGSDRLVADIIHGRESLVFISDNSFNRTPNYIEDDDLTSEDQEYGSYSIEQLSAHYSSPCSDSEHHCHDDNETELLVEDEEIPTKDADSLQNFDVNQDGPTQTPMDSPIFTDLDESNHKVHNEEDDISSNREIKQRVETDFSRSSDKVSAQKLQETESLSSIQACPRSISERIVHKFATMNKKPSDIRHNPYHELEAAYVGQICLTWEALNWNYKNFERKRAARKDFDCPAGIAQQFQQFQVLLQRYIENEPYEQGRRPVVYVRTRLLAPKLLLVPEYRDYEDDQRDEGFGSRISADSFLVIMEDGIQTFMKFLKADKEKPYQIIKALLGRKRKGLLDPTLVRLVKKVNAKKKMKLKDLGRTHKCLRKGKNKVEKMEILMGLIDLKVVSRVLRMRDLSEQQLHWCEEKMNKLRILEGGLQRDSSPLFFPAH